MTRPPAPGLCRGFCRACRDIFTCVFTRHEGSRSSREVGEAGRTKSVCLDTERDPKAAWVARRISKIGAIDA